MSAVVYNTLSGSLLVVNREKRRKISNTALLYLKRFKEIPPCRFDVVSIYYENGGPELELIRDAFEV